MKEIWKDVPGCEGKYQASNAGKIRSFCKNSNGRELTLMDNGNG